MVMWSVNLQILRFLCRCLCGRETALADNLQQLEALCCGASQSDRWFHSAVPRRESCNLLKVKTYNEMTKLEKNGMFLYESVPGTSVLEFKEADNSVEFIVEGDEDSQITVGLKDDTEYEVFIGGKNVGTMKTGLGGKLSLSVELEAAGEVPVKIVEA